MSNLKSKLVRVILPQYGMGMTEAKVTQWLKNEGDFIMEGEALVEIESAKSINEITAPATGVIESIQVAVDQDAKVYAVLCGIRVTTEAPLTQN